VSDPGKILVTLAISVALGGVCHRDHRRPGDESRRRVTCSSRIGFPESVAAGDFSMQALPAISPLDADI